jgi:hypothetical protein
LTFVGDNASSNDKQTARLHQLPNTFESVNCIQCFNHTMQLSVKALLRPFASTTSTASPVDTCTATSDDDTSDDNDDQSTSKEASEDEEEKEVGNDGGDSGAEDEVDEALDGLTDEEHEQLLENTATVRTTLDVIAGTYTSQEDGWG